MLAGLTVGPGVAVSGQGRCDHYRRHGTQSLREARGAKVSTYFLRRDVPIAVFPAERAEAVSKFFPLIMGSWELCRCVIETNLENINLLVHPAMALLNVGYYDRAEAAGDTVSFYGTGNT